MKRLQQVMLSQAVTNRLDTLLDIDVRMRRACLATCSQQGHAPLAVTGAEDAGIMPRAGPTAASVAGPASA